MPAPLTAPNGGRGHQFSRMASPHRERGSTGASSSSTTSPALMARAQKRQTVTALMPTRMAGRSAKETKGVSCGIPPMKGTVAFDVAERPKGRPKARRNADEGRSAEDEASHEAISPAEGLQQHDGRRAAGRPAAATRTWCQGQPQIVVIEGAEAEQQQGRPGS